MLTYRIFSFRLILVHKLEMGICDRKIHHADLGYCVDIRLEESNQRIADSWPRVIRLKTHSINRVVVNRDRDVSNLQSVGRDTSLPVQKGTIQ